MQTANELYKGRLLKGAVPEAANYPKALCNQQCKVHVYIKEGLPYDQSSGLKHDCYHVRIAKMFIGHYGMIRMDQIHGAILMDIEGIVKRQRDWCRKWALAFDNWKETGKVPTSEEVEGY